MLNKREPKNEPTVTPTTNYMSHLLVSFLSWLISSYGLVSGQVDQTFMCLALQYKVHGWSSQISQNDRLVEHQKFYLYQQQFSSFFIKLKGIVAYYNFSKTKPVFRKYIFKKGRRFSKHALFIHFDRVSKMLTGYSFVLHLFFLSYSTVSHLSI